MPYGILVHGIKMFLAVISAIKFLVTYEALERSLSTVNHVVPSEGVPPIGSVQTKRAFELFVVSSNAASGWR